MTARQLRQAIRECRELLDLDDCPVYLSLFDHKTGHVESVQIITVTVSPANTIELVAQWPDGGTTSQRRTP